MGDTEEKISQLQEIANIEEQAARRLLVATNWSLEDAIAIHFAGGADAALANPNVTANNNTVSANGIRNAPPASGGYPVSSRRPLDSDSDNEQQEAVARPAEDVGWFGSLGNKATSMMQTVLGVASEDFEHWFLTRFGAPVPQFSKGCFSETVKDALDKKKLLLLWFYQDEDEPTKALCRDILQNPLVMRIIRRNMIFWAGDVSRFEPGQIARQLSVFIFPSLVVCQPLRSGFDAQQFCLEWPLGTFVQPLFRLSPEEQGQAINADQAVATLTSVAEDHYEAQEVQQAESLQRQSRATEDRRLREEQDMEYQEALLMDQMAEVSRQEQQEQGLVSNSEATTTSANAAEATSSEASAAKAAADAEAAAVAAEAAEAAVVAAREAEDRAHEEEARKADGAEIAAMPEPTAADGVVAKLSLKLPDGGRLQRSFLASGSIEEVYQWAHCCRPSAKPWKFELCTNFPFKKLDDRTATLADSGLSPSAALLMRALDD